MKGKITLQIGDQHIDNVSNLDALRLASLIVAWIAGGESDLDKNLQDVSVINGTFERQI